jgi:predicted Zn-ribbon and HTH transcriptional regulator
MLQGFISGTIQKINMMNTKGGHNMKCTCKKCGHTWEPRVDHKVAACPKCKSYTWDKEKTKQGFKPVKD